MANLNTDTETIDKVINILLRHTLINANNTESVKQSLSNGEQNLKLNIEGTELWFTGKFSIDVYTKSTDTYELVDKANKDLQEINQQLYS